ncbi:hypothetical protein HNO88_000568 [Novosphingobium chloroacetimidivorans]|uniref:GDT1 family protein n=1 Tax=Novosphingobium chloroacetimidivorans TaxID=1428314 RepID=A0A7W7K6U5_9SPHN|nr:hypothetical protein [Novosphingobium chloroacetimidivorans]MBB4857261.1 hypothetical protein [Novosphingobium chloroacetimidivorans]
MLAGAMGAFYLTFVAVLLSGIAARDQVTIAALTRAQGQRFGVLVVALVLAGATSAFAAYAAAQMLSTVPVPARPILAAIALGLAGLESLILSPRANPKEPTHSLGALAIVLLAHQVTDAARFTLFGLAVGMGAPLAAGLGGGLAGVVLTAGAWAFPRALVSPRIRIARRIVGGLLLLVAITMFFRVRGIL